MRVSIFCLAVLAAASVGAADTPVLAPISERDVHAIKQAFERITTKPVILIMGVDESAHLPHTIAYDSYELDIDTRQKTPRYTHSDLVIVYVTCKDRQHGEAYTVRKIAGKWTIQEKADWSK
jgi:hypothetical protein